MIYHAERRQFWDTTTSEWIDELDVFDPRSMRLVAGLKEERKQELIDRVSTVIDTWSGDIVT